MPTDFCGLEIPQRLYQDLFPVGSDLEVVSSLTDPRTGPVGHECELMVDGEQVIFSETRGSDEFETAIDRYHLPVQVSEGEPVPGEYNAMVWPGVAMAQVPCPPENVISSFMVVLRAEHPEDEAESQQLLSELIQPYMAAAIELIPEYQCGS